MSAVTTKRFSRQEYHRLSELGFFSPEERVELIRGEIVKMAAKKTPHSVCSTSLIELLIIGLQGRAIVRSQEPIVLSNDSEPEPDVTILRDRQDKYLSTHPHPKDVLLLVEISETTLSYDRETKLQLYAEHGISDYWIFNLVDRCLKLYSDPLPEVKNYRSRQVFFPGETVSLPGFSDIKVDLDRIFPPTL